jgi:hypothetical protein
MSHNYQPRAYMSMLKREGRFRLLKSKLSKDIRIWHNCKDYGDADLEKGKTIFEVRYGDWQSWDEVEDEPCWTCTQCQEEAPEGLVGVYIMLDWDRATKEVADVAEWGRDSFRELAF